jgi:hypothetical protein
MPITKELGSELKVLYLSLIDEFKLKQGQLFKEINFQSAYAFVVGNIPFPGVHRDSKSHSIGTAHLFDKSYIYQKIHHCIKRIEASKAIYDFVIAHDLWHLTCDTYEKETQKYPSSTSGLIGGFICRTFEISGNLGITDKAFNQAFEELLLFLNKDYITTEVYIQLNGLKGDIAVIDINSDVSIEKASYDIAKFFSIHYTMSPQSYTINMFEGDYILRINFKFKKVEFDLLKRGNAFSKIREQVAKWQYAAILGCPGSIEIDKQIYHSLDWPVVNQNAIGPYGNQSHHIKGLSNSLLSEKDILNLQFVGKVIADLDVSKLDKKIIHSIERLAKSKYAKNINDRVVELSIALEYLINTTNSDVTLQLCLKTIRLVYEINYDVTIFKNLKKFYDLRSKVVHGNSTIELNDANKNLIDLTESLTQKAIVRYMELNKRFTCKQIDDSLLTSLHITKSLNRLLDELIEPA